MVHYGTTAEKPRTMTDRPIQSKFDAMRRKHKALVLHHDEQSQKTIYVTCDETETKGVHNLVAHIDNDGTVTKTEIDPLTVAKCINERGVAEVSAARIPE